VSTTDYGGSVFGEYFVWKPIFLHAEVEYLSYEVVDFDLSTERDGFTSVFVGGGSRRYRGTVLAYLEVPTTCPRRRRAEPVRQPRPWAWEPPSALEP
jgi:hypothetical protein